MRKSIKFLLIVLAGIALSSCNLFKDKDPNYQLSDLQHLWQEVNKEHFVRFTSEQAGEAGYFLGREWDNKEWDDPDMTFEEFLIWNREQLGHPCNGWFQYKLETKGDFEEIHFMDNGGAEIPKEYVVSVLTSEKLEYYEQGNKNRKFSFVRVAD